MRILLAVPLLLVAACNVSKDDANDAVTVEYDENTAANTVADVSNTAENIAGHIGNDVERTADKVQNTDVDVNVDRDVKTENRQ